MNPGGRKVLQRSRKRREKRWPVFVLDLDGGLMQETASLSETQSSVSGRRFGGAVTCRRSSTANTPALYRQLPRETARQRRVVPCGEGFDRPALRRRPVRDGSARRGRRRTLRQPWLRSAAPPALGGQRVRGRAAVPDESCSTPTTETTAPAGCANTRGVSFSASTTWPTGGWRSTRWRAPLTTPPSRSARSRRTGGPSSGHRGQDMPYAVVLPETVGPAHR